MRTIDLSSALQEVVEKYRISRDRWIKKVHSERFDSVRQVFVTAFDTGMFASMSELGAHFLIPGEMARRIYTGSKNLVGKDTIQLLAREHGIPEKSSKLRFFLTQLLPVFEKWKLVDGNVDVDNVEKLVNAIGRLDWSCYQQSSNYESWVDEQAKRFPNYTKAEIHAAAFWLAFRPRLPGCPNFLVRLARYNLSPIEANAFELDVLLVECLRNTARSVVFRHDRECDGLSDDDACERIMAYMWDELRERSPCRFDGDDDVVIGLMAKYGVDLDDLLSLTTGELLEKSLEIRRVTNQLLPFRAHSLQEIDECTTRT